MKPNGPTSKQVHSVCHNTLPWLISILLDAIPQFDECDAC